MYGPVLVSLSILLNFWTVMVYFVFPYTNLIIVNYERVNKPSMWAHYILAIIYFILLFMTVWSYLAARCTEPGYVPSDAVGYEVNKLPDKERILWDYLQRHGTFK